jgi:hypothetical protein
MKESMKAVVFALSATLVVGSLRPAWQANAQAAREKAIALVSKVILDVTRRPSATDWVKAQRGDILDAGDMVRTGERSIAVVKLKDNSLLRLQEKSLLTLTGFSNQGMFQKGVNVEGGFIGFNIRKQKPGEEFRFTSPTSVASIRGTEGVFILSDSGDVFTILTGLGRITNMISMTSVDVPAGYTVLSDPSGRLHLRLATDDERAEAARAASLTEEQRHLRLQFKNRTGEARDLIIDMKH